ncbi:hypothetical protein GCM10010275_70870 [Streptomyces litmocidini]|nr:hypothetical protein GCM10010275_70870 [Streptomyces litmocidini]
MTGALVDTVDRVPEKPARAAPRPCGGCLEVRLAGATEAPAVGAGCKPAEGEWLSYYDG